MLKRKLDLFLIGTLLLSLALRLKLSFLSGFKIDTDDFYYWSVQLSKLSFSDFYNSGFFADYTPGFLYILKFLGELRNVFHINDLYFYFLLKLPSTLAEMILGVLIYKRFKSNLITSRLLLILILFNPVFIFDTNIWGQVDGVLSLFLYLTIYFLEKKKFFWSSIFGATSFLIKPQAVVLIPIFIFFIVKERLWQEIWKFLLPAFCILVVFTLPFFPKDSLLGFSNLVLKTLNEYPYTSLNAFNLWGIVGFWITDQQTFFSLSYQTAGLILFAIYNIIIGKFYFKNKLMLLEVTALECLAFFFLPTRVHERYFYPGLLFLIITVVLKRNHILSFLAGILIALSFSNLYFVYIYYNFLYFHIPTPLYNPNLFQIISDNGKLFSIISTVIFVLISGVIIKLNYVKKISNS